MDEKLVLISALLIIIFIMLFNPNTTPKHRIIPGVPTPKHRIIPGVPTPKHRIIPGVPTPKHRIIPGVPTPKHQEGFANSYSELSTNQTDVLLEGWYPTHKPTPQLSDLTSAEQYKNYPAFSADSIYNNNIREWRKPNNGKCNPSGFCGNFYDFKEPQPSELLPTPGFSNSRVNYYISDK